MSDTAFQLIALAIYFAAMIAIGFWASRKNNNLDDYVLGGRGLTPGVAALSAGASDMSAWLLMGIPGIMYMVGLSEAWIIIGLTIGAWLNWKLVAPRLRTYTEVSRNGPSLLRQPPTRQNPHPTHCCSHHHSGFLHLLRLFRHGSWRQVLPVLLRW